MLEWRAKMKLIKKIWKPFCLVLAVGGSIEAFLIWTGCYYPSTYVAGMDCFVNALFVGMLAFVKINDKEA